MKTQHTPGPWTIGDEMATIQGQETGNIYINAFNYVWIAEAKGDHVNPVCREEIEANARLMAAAPELLKACERALGMLANCQPVDGYKNGVGTIDDCYQQLIEAIAKATGEKEVVL